MTDPTPIPEPDYTAQHRVEALRASVALAQAGLWHVPDIQEVLNKAEVLLEYLNTGVIPE